MKSHPPIVQLLFTVQFQPSALSLSVLDWAELRELFSADLPVFTQSPRAGPMPARLGMSTVEVPFGMPRLTMASSDLAEVVLLQDDRVSVGWQRTSPLTADPAYPGFSATLARTISTVEIVLAFIQRKATEEVQLSVGELSYTDAFLTHQDGALVRRLEDIFTTINSHKSFSFNALNLTFQKNLLLERGDPFNGMSETTISGFVPTPDGQLAVNLQTVVRFEFDAEISDQMPEKYHAAHAVAEEIFDTLVKPEAYAILDGQ